MSIDYLSSLSIMPECHDRNGTRLLCINHLVEWSSLG